MTGLNVKRRTVLQGMAAAASASAFVDQLIHPANAQEMSDRPLRVRTNRDINTVDPGYMVGGFEMVWQFACMPRLVSYVPGDEWGWMPSQFVESIEQVDPQTISFALKPGFMWRDATTHEAIGEVTAEDVKFSLERMAESEWKDKAAALDNVEVTGTYSGLIHLNAPFAAIFYTWFADGTGTIVSKAWYDANEATMFEGLPAFYCGPYRPVEWVQSQRWVIEADPEFAGTPPHIKTVRVILIADDKAAEIAFEAGEVDITLIAIESIPRYQENLPAGAVLEVFDSTQWYWMGMNTEHPNLQDIRVRQAIQHAVDVETIIQGAWGGVPTRARGVVTPGLIGYRETTRYETPDPDAARALLAEAGVEGLKITLKTINIADRLAAAQIIQANLADVGIEVEIVPMDAGPFWNLGLESEGEEWKDLEMWIMQYGDSPDPSQMVQWYVSGQKGIWNWERWTNPEFDELFSAGLAETDEDKRHEIYVRMQEIMEETGAYVWLMFPPLGALYRDDLEVSIRPNSQLWYFSDFAWA